MNEQVTHNSVHNTKEGKTPKSTTKKSRVQPSQDHVTNGCEAASIGPLVFTPHLIPKIWGGKRLYALHHIPETEHVVGESWLVSALPNDCSMVAKGPLTGLSLIQVMNKYSEQILGPSLVKLYGKKFPLLVKYIDATEDLSLQVHPGKKEQGGELGGKKANLEKNEIWYMIDPLPDAEIVYGLSQDLSAHELVEYTIEGRLLDFVRRIPVSKGDLYDIPAGTIHALLKGNLTLEVQQSVDVTYRLWDYDRVEKDTGRKRTLHLAEAVDASILTRCRDHNHPYRALPNGTTLLIEKDFAVMEMIWVSSQGLKYQPLNPESFAIIVGISGETSFKDRSGNEVMISKGDCVLFPYSSMPLEISNNSESKLISISVPLPFKV